MRLDWDPGKAQTNKRRHGVTFDEASECFYDVLAMILEDAVHDDRLILIGSSTRSRLILTVYIELEGDLVRIISARLASRKERRMYEEGEF